MPLHETAKFTVEFVLSTINPGELPTNEEVEAAISHGIVHFNPNADVLYVTTTDRTGEL